MEKCKDCKWWVGSTGAGTGNCHKRAPIAIHDEKKVIGNGEIRNPYRQEIMPGWPCVADGNFCGEFEAKNG